MRLKFLFITLLLSTLAFAQNKGILSGKILDKEANNQPLPFANILIKNTKIATNTDVDGNFSLNVPAGTHHVVISFLGYEPLETKVVIEEGKTTSLNKTLGSAGYTLNDVVVKAKVVNREKETALMLEQKNAVVIKQSIGAQEMSRKGVSDVEEGLTKMTGISKVGSRGVFVRGLEDRYNNLLINDLAAPTNNPFLKITPLDLFPTNVVGVIDVYKTFNPNLYGDFAGGTFNIQTSKGTKAISKLNIGFGFTTQNTAETFLQSTDSNNAAGFFGLNGSDRALPTILGSIPRNYTFTSQQSKNAFKSGFDVAESKAPLNSSISLLHSEKFNFNNNRSLGYLISLNFDNNYSIRTGVDRTLTGLTDLVYNNNLVSTEYRYKTTSSALVGLNYNTNRLKLGYNTLFINTTLNSIKDQKGIFNQNDIEPNQFIRTNQLDKTFYLNNQLSAEYALNNDKTQIIKAAASYANTKYEQPDRKFFGGVIDSNNNISVAYGGNNFLRQYLTLDGNQFVSGMAEYQYTFGKQNKLTAGVNGYSSDVTSSYRFIATSTGPAFTTNVNQIDQQIQTDLTNQSFSFRESSNATYKVLLNENAMAGYANLLYKWNENLEINAGVRVENTLRETKYRALGSITAPYKTRSYDNLYFLPSLNIKYQMNDTQNIRFAASKTYTKPVLMESFPISYINADGTSVQGNTLLKNSDNYNADLKFEWFPKPTEMIVLGLFAKNIKNPIERTFIANASSSTITTFLNSDSANLFGAEAELIIGLDRIMPELKKVSLGINASVMATKVQVSPYYDSQDESGYVTRSKSIETHNSRALQGASNWLTNADLKYDFDFSKDWSNTVSLVYGVFGKRIFAVGTNNQDHVYELPIQQLDLVWSSKINKHFDFKFTIDNIINPDRKLEFGNDTPATISANSLIQSSYKKGIGFSAKLGYTF